ncbi:MAG: 50S ribosomal protein L28 [Chloroflexota bacterium]|nr:50S ribosomal protein L28 [Chloroflexota bacterium]
MAGTGTCDICGKHSMFGHNVSHAANATNRRFAPNIQSAHLMVDGVSKKMQVCTRCLRTLSKTPKTK